MFLSRSERDPRITWRAREGDAPLPPLSAGLSGWEVQRSRPSHLNARRRHEGRDYFLKWFRHHRFRSPARAEWENARRLAALGIPTVLARGWGTHSRGSFVLLEGSRGEQADRWWQAERDLERAGRFAEELARLVALLHGAGLSHRDLNVYHVLVDGDLLRVIDVGRVFRFHPLRRGRWVVKDIASLLDSARREGFPESLARHFFRAYLRAAGLRAAGRGGEGRRLLAAVLAKAARYTRHNRKKEARGLVP
jgi:tRNA A-37 threonylcarbamoyl transferase component Bud32